MRPLRRRKKTTQEKTAIVRAQEKEEQVVRKEAEIRGVGSSGRVEEGQMNQSRVKDRKRLGQREGVEEAPRERQGERGLTAKKWKKERKKE